MERFARPVAVHRRMVSAHSAIVERRRRPPHGSRPCDRGEPARTRPRSAAVLHQPESETTMSVRAITEVISSVRTGKPLATPAMN
jgi:hypothetical protein